MLAVTNRGSIRERLLQTSNTSEFPGSTLRQRPDVVERGKGGGGIRIWTGYFKLDTSHGAIEYLELSSQCPLLAFRKSISSLYKAVSDILLT